MGTENYKFGFASEDKAAEILEKNGFEILERNFHSRFGEIDIIAKKDKILHFVEVKATNGDYDTAYRVTPSKMSKILATINFYIYTHSMEEYFQIDLIEIFPGGFKITENITL